MKKYVAIIIVVIGCLTISIYVLANRSYNVPTDNSLLKQQPCKIPCWHGLVPGKSTLDDVHKITASDNFIPPDEYQKDVDSTEPHNTLFWWFGNPENANRIIIDNGVVTSIQIVPNTSFSIKDILNLYGMPSGMFITPNRRSDTDLYIEVSLCYPQLGLMVDFNLLGGKPSTTKYYLSLDTLGKGFRIYQQSDSLRNLIAEATGFQNTDLDKTMNTYVVNNWTKSDSVVVVPSDVDKSFLVQTITPTP